jgi:hypothetical protein
LVDGTAELPNDLPAWDYDTVLSLQRSLTVDGARARAESGLGMDAELAISARWTASGSLLRGRAWQSGVPAVDDVELIAEFDLPGSELGGTLDLALVLTVVDPGAAPSAVAPRRRGSVLWTDSHPVRLQGNATHFPIAVADFEQLPYPSETTWFLDIGDDLEAAALGSLLLIVNESRDVVVEALTGVAEPSPTTNAIMSVLWTDTLRSLVERAVTDDEFDQGNDYPTGSLGAVLRAILRDRFPDEDLESLRREHDQDPALFTSRIQAAARMLGGTR